MTELIVLTCASGKQCSHIVPLLYARPESFRLRLVVHSQKSLERLKSQFPDAEVVQANLAVPMDCSRILDGATTIYYIGPTFQTHEVQYGINCIDAAVAEVAKSNTSFSHFVLSSVIQRSPGHFADNAIGRLIGQKDAAAPVFTATQNPEIAFSFSCLRDHAEVSVKVITERFKHFFATYQLVSTWPMSYSEYISSIGDVLGKKFEVKQMAYEESIEAYTRLVFGTDGPVGQNLCDGPERLLLYYNRRGIIGNPSVMEWLLGRPPTSPAQLAKLMVENIKS